MPQNYGIALLITFLAGLATAIGAGIAFVVKRDNMKVLSIGLGFSAGVMIFLSFVDIIPSAGEMLKSVFPNKYNWIVYLSFIIGLIIAILIDYFLPDHVDEDEMLNPDMPAKHNSMIKHAGLLTAVAICVHNFPEGMATFMTSTQDLTLGLSVGLAIAIHNIPEGIAVALPVYQATGKRRYAMLYAALSGVSEPIGAVIGMFLLHLFLPQIMVGASMAAVAGIMIYISFDTLLPLAKEYGNWHLSMIGIVSGILFIWTSLLLMP